MTPRGTTSTAGLVIAFVVLGAATLGVLAPVLALNEPGGRADTERVRGSDVPRWNTAQAMQAAGRRALTLTSAPAGLGYVLRFEAASAGSPRAQTDRDRRLITVFLRPGDAAHRVAHDIAHEYGHAWDDRRGTDASRAAYLAARGVPGAAWWPTRPGDDYATGAGDFAEVFARCHAPSPEFRGRLTEPPADACAALPAGARALAGAAA